jgi:hypothetical protein
MTAITIDTITLPGDLEWSDEFDWSPVVQSVEPTLTGALIIDESAQLTGRPVTLAGGADFGWVTRDVIEALYLLLTPGREMTLTLADARTFTVTWRHGDKPIDARPIQHAAPLIATDAYSITLNLMQVD